MSHRERTRRRARAGKSGSKLPRVATNTIRHLRRLYNAPTLVAFPIWIYLLIAASDSFSWHQALTTLGDVDVFARGSDGAETAAKASADAIVKQLQAMGYLVTLLLLLGRLKDLFSFLFRDKALLACVCALTLTIVQSEVPDRVIASIVHVVFGIAAAWLYCNHTTVRNDPVYKIGKVTMLAVLAIQMGSLLLAVLHIDTVAAGLSAGLRLGGLAGHPNSLGTVSLLSIWGCLAMLHAMSNELSARRILVLFVLATTIINLATTGSATSQVLGGLTVAGLFTTSLFGRLSKRQKALVILTTAALALGALYFTVIGGLSGDLAVIATESVGKDITLTGRTDLWVVAIDAFTERPFLGWGFDYHETVFSDPRFQVGYNQYHNGFLDTLVNGGIMLLTVFMYAIWLFFKRAARTSRQSDSLVPFVVICLVCIAQNATEYTIFRPNNPAWMLWILSYIAVAMSDISTSSSRRSSLNSPRRRIRRSSGRVTPAASW